MFNKFKTLNSPNNILFHNEDDFDEEMNEEDYDQF